MDGEEYEVLFLARLMTSWRAFHLLPVYYMNLCRPTRQEVFVKNFYEVFEWLHICFWFPAFYTNAEKGKTNTKNCIGNEDDSLLGYRTV
jgi:hypothetical protein